MALESLILTKKLSLPASMSSLLFQENPKNGFPPKVSRIQYPIKHFSNFATIKHI